MKIVFVVNNRNNRLAGALPELDQCFRKAGLGNVQFLPTLWKNHAIELSRQAVENSCDYLIAVGGDGTLHEVINGIFQSNLPVNHYPVIGLLPLGSANDFAKTAGLSASNKALLALIQEKSWRKIDLGRIYLPQSRESRYFINIASAGLSAEVVRHLNTSRSLFGPGFNYFKNILRGFITYRKKETSCQGGSWQWSGKMLQMAVAKGRYFGHGICVAPDADIDDGQFQIAFFGDLSIWDYLKNIRKLKQGMKIDHPRAYYDNTREIRIESDDLCGIEADGEYVGLAPATISVVPKVIRFLMPSDL